MSTKPNNNPENLDKVPQKEGKQSKLEQYRQKLLNDPQEREDLKSNFQEVDKAYEDFRTNGKLPDSWKLLRDF